MQGDHDVFFIAYGVPVEHMFAVHLKAEDGQQFSKGLVGGEYEIVTHTVKDAKKLVIRWKSVYGSEYGGLGTGGQMFELESEFGSAPFQPAKGEKKVSELEEGVSGYKKIAAKSFGVLVKGGRFAVLVGRQFCDR